jgi:segregation and condensation protein A
MSYSVALLNFEGPLDLLLQLIERSELSIAEISLAQVTEQYLAYIDKLPQLDPVELHQFLELAAKLLHLKSQVLLAEQIDSELEEEISELAEQLEQYRHYQKATIYINGLLRQPMRSWQRETRANLPLEKVPDPQLDAQALNQAFRTAMSKLPVMTQESLQVEVHLEDMMVRITKQLQKQGEVHLNALMQPLRNRLEAMVLFLALLELLKSGEVSVQQHNQFDDIIIEAAKG